MTQRSFTFAETSPAAPGTSASSAAVVGSDSTANGVAFGDLDRMQSLSVYAALVGATGGTLDVYIQTSPNQGTTWVDYAHFAQLGIAAAAVKYTFTASKGAQLLTPTAVGVGLTPALAAGTVLGGEWGDRFRLVMVAGAGTTAGAAVSVILVASRMLA